MHASTARSLAAALALSVAGTAALPTAHAASGAPAASPAKAAPASSPAPLPSDFSVLPKPGKKVTLDAGHYFVYGFTKPAKIGMSIMRVEVFTRDGRHDTSFVVKGDADMPSMRGAHTMGDKPFSLSKKGEYLLPIPLVMPGDWEVRLTFVKEGKTVLRGIYLFDL
jgi:hypothetical protein